MHERCEEEKHEMLGTDLDRDELRAEKEGSADMDVAVVDSNIEGNDYPLLNLKSESYVEDYKLIGENPNLDQVSEHVENNIADGVLSFKVRPTWKRLARMVYGLDSANEVNLPILGKRDTTQKEYTEGWDSIVLVQKREKVDGQITQKTIAAGASNCPRQAR